MAMPFDLFNIKKKMRSSTCSVGLPSSYTRDSMNKNAKA